MEPKFRKDAKLRAWGATVDDVEVEVVEGVEEAGVVVVAEGTVVVGPDTSK